MKIGITLHPYDEEKSSGLGRHILELTKGLIESEKENEYIVLLKKKPKKIPEFSGSNWKVVISDGGLFWLDNVIKKAEKADAYIFNTPIMPIFQKAKNSIVIAFDFAYIHLKAKSLKQYIKNKILYLYHSYSFKKSDHIVATSKSTKEDVFKLFKISKDKITVISPGFKKICSLQEKKIDLPDNFFFFIGVIKERKNVLNIVKGFIEFKENIDNDYKLVIAGSNKGEYYEQILEYINKKGMNNEVVFLGYITDEEAAYVYKHAKAFVFVTLIEGAMGMPVLEAMDCGLPVVTSNTSTFTEFNAVDAAVAVDPLSYKEISNGLKKVISNENLRNNLVQKGYNFSERFDWRNIAKRFVEVAERLYKN